MSASAPANACNSPSSPLPASPAYRAARPCAIPPYPDTRRDCAALFPARAETRGSVFFRARRALRQCAQQPHCGRSVAPQAPCSEEFLLPLNKKWATLNQNNAAESIFLLKMVIVSVLLRRCGLQLCSGMFLLSKPNAEERLENAFRYPGKSASQQMHVARLRTAKGRPSGSTSADISQAAVPSAFGGSPRPFRPWAVRANALFQRVPAERTAAFIPASVRYGTFFVPWYDAEHFNIPLLRSISVRTAIA